MLKTSHNTEPVEALISDDKFVVPTLTSLTESDSETVLARMEAEKNELGINVRRAMTKMECTPYVWTDNLDRFYQTTDAFLFETLVYNRSSFKKDLRRLVLRFAEKHRNPNGAIRVLIYGDGLGIDSCYLAARGYDVDYYEVSHTCIRFATALRTRLGLHFRILSDVDQIQDNNYDLVIALDVLEHVPDPPALTRALTRRLKMGGVLMVNAPFWFVEPAVQTHLARNKMYSGDLKTVFSPAGLSPVDCGVLWSPIVFIKTGFPLKALPLLSVRRLKLYSTGAFLAIARVTNLPHLLLIRLAMRSTWKLRIR